jgi:hypothetical protein
MHTLLFEMHPGGVEPSPHPYGSLQTQLASIFSMHPGASVTRQSFVFKALTSPPCPGSQDYPTVPGYPVAAAVVCPTSHAAVPIRGLLLVYEGIVGMIAAVGYPLKKVVALSH